MDKHLFILFITYFLCISVASAAMSHKNTMFASNSCWRAKLPASAPIHSQSAQYITDLMRQINITGYVWINTQDFSVPLYYVDSNQATSKVTITSNNDAQLQAFADITPVPTGAKQAGGSDGSILFYQESMDRLWEFWQYNPSANTATWGGYMENVSTNPGFYMNPHPKWGVAATSIPLSGGIMTLADYQAGVFPYALKLTLQDYASGYFVAPAMRTDGDGKSVIPQGTRFRLPATYNVSQITNPFARMMATAMRDYGLITTDTSGGVVVAAEDPTQYMKSGDPNPWATIWGTPYPSAFTKLIPWNLLEVVDPSWQPWNPMSQYYQQGDHTGPSSYTEGVRAVVYNDTLAASWQDYSWASPRTFTATDHVYKGTYSIKVTFDNTANAFSLHFNGGNIDTTAYNAIEFMVMGIAETNYQWSGFSIVQLVNSNKALGGEARLGSYFANGVPTTWTKVTIPFSDMAWTPGTPFQGFWVQSQMTVANQISLYFDEIYLVKLNAVYSSPTTTTTSKPTSTSSSPSASTSTPPSSSTPSPSSSSSSTPSSSTGVSPTSSTSSPSPSSGSYVSLSLVLFLAAAFVHL